MTAIPRLNGVIRALEAGKPAFSTWASPDPNSVIALSTSSYDSVLFEMEHRVWDGSALRDGMQYLLNRGQILKGGSPAPAVTPLVRIPANGVEKNQWMAKQALDLGAYGVMFPHISTVDQAYNAIASCRYPRPRGAPLYEPVGCRGYGNTTAIRYWGVDADEYNRRADVWPLAPDGEILTMLMIEDPVAIANLGDILKNVPGIGIIVIGIADLSTELGYPRQVDRPAVVEAMAEIRAICKKHKVPVGYPVVDMSNIERLIAEGYSFFFTNPVMSTPAIDLGRKIFGNRG